MSQVSLIDEGFALFDKPVRVDLLGGFSESSTPHAPSAHSRYQYRLARRHKRRYRCTAVYRAAKAAVIALPRNSALERGGLGIRVNGISLGPIDTPLVGAGLPTRRRSTHLSIVVLRSSALRPSEAGALFVVTGSGVPLRVPFSAPEILSNIGR
jgi:NAD(P)-dependent dehydrogenase (short-subunit alcohol dehydrogenase family)